MIPLILFLSGCLNNDESTESKIEISYSYVVSISHIKGKDLSVIIPLVISDNGTNIPTGKSYDILSSQIQSNPQIEKSKYGYGFKIQTNQDIILEYEDSFSLELGMEYDHYLLSMENGSLSDWSANTHYWLFTDKDPNDSVTISIQFTHITESGKSKWNTQINIDQDNLKNGWNEISGVKATKVS